MALILVEADHSMGLAAAVFAVAALSDFLDGFLARRWQQTSLLGGILDSVADKLLVTGTLFALVEVGRVWAWAAFLIVGREIGVMTLRRIAAHVDERVPPSILGKWKATIQFAAMFLAILRLPEPWGALFFDEWAMLVAVAITVLSGIEYFARFARVIRAVARS